jgi:UDP-N-acetyl-D-glucosamine dehydrogenase
MADHQLSLAINGRERLLQDKLVPFQPRNALARSGLPGAAAERLESVLVVGLGYVGLPTALALHDTCQRVIGLDVSQSRLAEIAAQRADLAEPDRERLAVALGDGSFQLTADPRMLNQADAVIVCVPTPVDDQQIPDLRALRAACRTVVDRARPGQVIILTSTSYIGTTRELLIDPLEERGLAVGSDIFVAFSPERIDPGNPDHRQEDTPRVVGGTTRRCSDLAAALIQRITPVIYLVSSPEAAEASKLYENIFRAVCLALANEFADACHQLRVDPIEVTLAAGTKPYGFLGTFPGPGVGGHCIPCDPHYLLWQLAGTPLHTPLIRQAMTSIRRRPDRVAERAAQVLSTIGRDLADARVLVVGASYKPGVRDLRESPALPLITMLLERAAEVSYFDPLIPELTIGEVTLTSAALPADGGWDLVIIHTVHPGVDYSWIPDTKLVLDATYLFDAAPEREVP